MAIDETITRTKSAGASTETEHENNSTVPARMGYLLARKNRIERWAYKGRSSSTSDTATTASANLGTVSAQKRSESSYSQAGRVLNLRLLQLSEQRQKIIDRNNFDQKLFANKQALKYKDNQYLLKTLNYVRKCCKYADTNGDEKDNINPAIFLEENPTGRRSRSRSPSLTPTTLKRNLSANARTQTSASMAETFLRHNRKHLGPSPIHKKLIGSKTPTVTNPSETLNDDDAQKRHVQFQIHTEGAHLSSQSAHIITSKLNTSSVDKQIIRNVASANGVRSSNSSRETRSTNSAPIMRTMADPSNEQMTESSKSKRRVSRISSAKSIVEEFRLHPERFLSASNRYLPLLRRQALEAESRESSSKQQKEKNDSIKKSRRHLSPPLSRLSDGSDLTYDDAKSFLSEDNDLGKPIQTPEWLDYERKTGKRFRTASKLNLLDTNDDIDINEHRRIMSRLREREYARLHELIRSNTIEKILEPFSAIKTDEANPVDPNDDKHSNYRRSSIDQPPSSSRIRQLNDILRSIDSLRCSDTVDRRARRQVDIEKNRAKLGILIF